MEKWCEEQEAFKKGEAFKKIQKKTKNAKPYTKSWRVRARFASRWMAEMMKNKKKKKRTKTFSTSGFSSQRFSKIVPRPA